MDGSLDMEVFAFPGSSDLVIAYDNVDILRDAVTIGKETETYRVMLNKFGRAKLRLERAKQPGKLTVKVAYAGDAAVLAGKKKATIRVVRKQ